MDPSDDIPPEIEPALPEPGAGGKPKFALTADQLVVPAVGSPPPGRPIFTGSGLRNAAQSILDALERMNLRSENVGLSL